MLAMQIHVKELSIKYEYGGIRKGVTVCDRGRGEEHMTTHFKKFHRPTYETWNWKWCLTFCCNGCILTEGGTGKNHPGTKPSRQKYPGQTPRGHWRRLVKNIGWTNENIGGQKVIKSDKRMGFSQLFGGTCHMPGLPPKSTPMPADKNPRELRQTPWRDKLFIRNVWRT